MTTLPRHTIAPAPPGWGADADPLAWPWDLVPPITPFVLADGSRPAAQQTAARLCADRQALYARFDCMDRDIWATHTRRDAPLYDEEVVEIFLSPGSQTPTSYYELEVSPDGVLLDARIHNPHSRRADLSVDLSWDADAQWLARRDDAAGRWLAILILPWAALNADPPPPVWRGNLYRIERPRDGTPEFSCWSPTLTEPADFHKPERFGFLILPDL